MNTITLHLRFLLIGIFCLGNSLSLSAQYKPDRLKDGFVYRTFSMGTDYDGKVVTTLVRKSTSKTTHRALLYVHGFNDYFFQKELADRFNQDAFNFYAVDLRKYGRSLLPHQIPFRVRSLTEYFADIDTALATIRAEGNTEIVLMGHSTGGLITALYCQKHRENLPVEGLILNSPFLDMNLNPFTEKIVIPTLALYGKYFPNTTIDQGNSTAYAESLLKSYHGEWNYDTRLKLKISPPLSTGWIRAIHEGQKQVQDGLQIPCPILLLYSDKSVSGEKWSQLYQEGDGVLDVADIYRYGIKLGPRVTPLEIPGGLHDLALSRKSVRAHFYRSIFSWLNRTVF